ncbi:unnamed protein product [Prorocentrum cordatum]|uniref:MULE transposase domain-containing protein n=1 Tax=Prorocentrum cordatum TaxID=2364126 RepID=A0ABN9VGA8_9DINO|nr:unnamed protein product [Polarella glacialis]
MWPYVLATAGAALWLYCGGGEPDGRWFLAIWLYCAVVVLFAVVIVHLSSACQFVLSKRNGQKLIHDGFIYNLRYTAKNGNRTWCCEKGAQVYGGQVQARVEGLRAVVQQATLRAHLPTPDKAVAEQVRTRASAAAWQQPDATAANVASAALAGVPQASLAATPTATNLKRACWRARLSEQNKRLKSGEQAPQDFDCSTLEVPAVPDTLKQVDGEEFLARDSGCSGRRAHPGVGGCTKYFDFLATAGVWLADGTFRVAPAPFLQGPEPTLLLDYEKASYQAASAVFHEINICGCYFHFRAAVRERAVDLGLSNRCGGNAELELVSYFEKTWVGEKLARARVRKAPVSPVDIWNVHHRTLDEKFLATNAAELFHRHRAAQFHKGARPACPTFILSLHKQQRITSRDIAEIAMGGEKKLRESTRVRGDKQCNLVNKYLGDKGGISLVTQLAHLAMGEE